MKPGQKPPGTRLQRVSNLRDRLRGQASLILSERTPYEVIGEQDIVRLRWYPPLQAEEIAVGQQRVPVQHDVRVVPLVIVPPLAVNMSIYDLFEDRSLVRYLRARGFSVYLIDWGRPQARHNHWNLETYITELMPKLLEQVRRHAGTRTLSLHGWSFGGMLAYSYTAWSGDRDIRNIALIGAPCDYHDNGVVGQQQQRLGRLIKAAGRIRALRPHASPSWLWRSPGWLNSTIYKLTSPVASLKPHLELLRKLHDRDAVAAHATNAAFADDMVAYPGAVIQDTMQYLWANNALGKGRVPIAGSDARLASITAKLLVVAGRNDPIVTASCTKALLKFVASPDQTFLEVPGGHMAIVSGKNAPTEVWPAVADWLLARS